MPKMPTWGSFCVAVASGGYRLDMESRKDPKGDDFRHMIPLESDLRVVAHMASADAQMVATSLKGYQSAVNTVRKEAYETLSTP